MPRETQGFSINEAVPTAWRFWITKSIQQYKYKYDSGWELQQVCTSTCTCVLGTCAPGLPHNVFQRPKNKNPLQQSGRPRPALLVPQVWPTCTLNAFASLAPRRCFVRPTLDASNERHVGRRATASGAKTNPDRCLLTTYHLKSELFAGTDL